MEKRVCTKERQHRYLLVSLVSLAPLSISVTKFWEGFRKTDYSTISQNSIIQKHRLLIKLS